MTNPHDPLARVLFALLRDTLPIGVLDAAIERARFLSSVPDLPTGAVARDAAQRIRTLPVAVD